MSDSETILETIRVGAKKILKDATLDKTYVGIVTQVITSTKYLVKYNNAERIIRTENNLELKVGDKVHVTYPQNNQNLKYLNEDVPGKTGTSGGVTSVDGLTGVVDLSEKYATKTLVNTNLETAKQYADTKKSEAITTAATDASAKSNSALTNAKTYTNTKINELVNGAPETLDTLKEVADAIAENETVVEALNSAIGTKTNQTEFDAHVNDSTVHITSDEHTGLTDTISKKHSHSNKTILDGITSALITVWNSAVTHISDTVKHITANERTLWNTAYNHSQTAHAPSNAQANQNAFSNITVGNSTISAGNSTDTLSLVAGDNVTLTPDLDSNKITISSNGSSLSKIAEYINLSELGLDSTATLETIATTMPLNSHLTTVLNVGSVANPNTANVFLFEALKSELSSSSAHMVTFKATTLGGNQRDTYVARYTSSASIKLMGWIKVATQSDIDGKLSLSGGTMAQASQIGKLGKLSNWYNGRDCSLVKISSANGYAPLGSMKTSNGSWDYGTYTNEKMIFNYVTDTNYSNATNTAKQIIFNSDGSITVNGISTDSATGSAVTQSMNVTTSGYVADARALKTVNDKVSTLNSDLAKKEFGTPINLSSYTTTRYTCPCDGYARVKCSWTTAHYARLYVNGETMLTVASGNTSVMNTHPCAALFVRKGMQLHFGTSGHSDNSCYFFPFA